MKTSDIIYIAMGFSALIVTGIEAACLAGIAHSYKMSLAQEKEARTQLNPARAKIQHIKHKLKQRLKCNS